MSWFMVDVESDGPAPGLYSMICFGAVLIKEDLSEAAFYGKLRPVTDQYIPVALDISGFTRADTERFPPPAETMRDFRDWILRVNKGGNPKFISDNNGFDWQFINWYFWKFCPDGNPFGHSSTNLGSLYKGMVKDSRQNFKRLRQTVHDHNPVNDARGNAEALLHMIEKMGLQWKLE